MNNDNIFDMFKKKMEEELQRMQHANIIIAGKTGVGKSTLINAAFREKMADTGVGKPVTKQCRLIEKKDFPLRIYDTVGLELNNETQKEKIDEISNLIKEKINKGNNDEFIHCMWYCIQSNSDRFEESEQNFIKKISEDIPVILVLTKVITKKQADLFLCELEKFNLPVKNIIKVLAMDYEDDDRIKPAFGVDELVEFTNIILPESAQKAWVNAQKASLKIKKEKAQTIILSTAAASFGEGYVPIPFSDAFALVPTQIAMIAAITATYGINVNKSIMTGFITSLVGTAGTTLAGRTIVSNLLKMIPGVGTVVGGTISGVTAAILTTALGEAYVYLMEMILKGEIDINDLDSVDTKEKIKSIFKKELRRK